MNDNDKKYNDTNKKYLEAVGKILDIYEGREVIWEIISRCGVFRNAAVNNDITGVTETYFNAGKQLIGQQILADITPEVFLMMQKENAIRIKDMETKGKEEKE